MSCIPKSFKKELKHLDWNKVIDNYIVTNQMSSEDYESLSPEQMLIIQELKKAFKRLKKLSTASNLLKNNK